MITSKANYARDTEKGCNSICTLKIRVNLLKILKGTVNSNCSCNACSILTVTISPSLANPWDKCGPSGLGVGILSILPVPGVGNGTSSVKKKLGRRRGVTARIEPCISDQALDATTIVKSVILLLFKDKTVNFLFYFSFGMVMGHL